MNIEQHGYKRADLLIVMGRVDNFNCRALGDALKNVIDERRYNVVVDLEQVDFMSSGGLRALVEALKQCKNHGGDVRLVKPSKRVSEALDIGGLSGVFSAFDDQPSAVGSY